MNYDERGKVINNLAESLNSMFYYQVIPEIEEVRKSASEMTDEQFLVHLRGLNILYRCADCFDAAQYFERMRRDRYYSRPLCIVCRDKNVERLFLNKRYAKRDPNDGHYKITAQQASAIMKGRAA